MRNTYNPIQINKQQTNKQTDGQTNTSNLSCKEKDRERKTKHSEGKGGEEEIILKEETERDKRTGKGEKGEEMKGLYQHTRCT